MHNCKTQILYIVTHQGGLIAQNLEADTCSQHNRASVCFFLTDSQVHTPFVNNTHRGRPIVSRTSSITEKSHDMAHHP